MKIEAEQVLCRVHLTNLTRHGASPLYEWIVETARREGAQGFGRHSLMHSAKLLEMSTDLPIVIEIVDAEEKVRAFLPVVDELVTEGLVTLEAVRVLKNVAEADVR